MSGNTLHDVSGNSHHGEINGATWVAGDKGQFYLYVNGELMAEYLIYTNAIVKEADTPLTIGYSLGTNNNNENLNTHFSGAIDEIRILKIAAVPVPIPVELVIFNASINGYSVELTWITATETNNYGFYIERKIEDKWEELKFIQGKGTTSERTEYRFFDDFENISYNDKVRYRLRQVDFNGSINYSDEIELLLDFVPTKYSVDQNYPNPFNPTTTIKYSIPNVGARHALPVQLIVYDILGNKVSILVNENKEQGYYEVKFDASNLPSGVYIYRINIGDKYAAIKKMMLLK